MRLRRQRAVEADDVGGRDERAQVVVRSGEHRSRAERLDEAGGLPADAPGPDDADQLPVEALAEHELERKAPRLAPADQAVALGDATKQ